MYKYLRSSVGLTLVEVLVSMAILAIVITPLTGFFLITSNRTRHNIVERQALTVAEEHIESLRQEHFLFVLKGEMDPIERGKFTIYTQVEDVMVPVPGMEDDDNMAHVTIRVAWQGGEVTLSTLVSQFRR